MLQFKDQKGLRRQILKSYIKDFSQEIRDHGSMPNNSNSISNQEKVQTILDSL